MQNKNITAVDWYFDKIKSHFEHDGDLFEVATFTYAIAKQKEREQQEVMLIGLLEWMNKVTNETPMRLETDNYDIVDQYLMETYGRA